MNSCIGCPYWEGGPFCAVNEPTPEDANCFMEEKNTSKSEENRVAANVNECIYCNDEIICISREECPYCDNEGFCLHQEFFSDMLSCSDIWEMDKCPLRRHE